MKGQTRPNMLLRAIHHAVERKQAAERVRLLSEVTAQLLASDQPQEIVESLCRKAMKHLDCHVFFNFLVDEEAGRLHLNACAGIPDETARQIEWLDLGMAVCGCAARDALPDRGRAHPDTRPIPAPIWSARSASRRMPATR